MRFDHEKLIHCEKKIRRRDPFWLTRKPRLLWPRFHVELKTKFIFDTFHYQVPNFKQYLKIHTFDNLGKKANFWENSVNAISE